MPPFLSLVTTVAILWIGAGPRVTEGLHERRIARRHANAAGEPEPAIRRLVRLGSKRAVASGGTGPARRCASVPARPGFVPRERSEMMRRETRAGHRMPRPKPRRLSGHLEFRNVTFGYRRTLDEPLIQNFSLEVQPGFAGRPRGYSGSGKSTIGRLATGLTGPGQARCWTTDGPIDEIPRKYSPIRWPLSTIGPSCSAGPSRTTSRSGTKQSPR